MNEIIRKLRFAGQPKVLVLNAPAEFQPIVAEMVKEGITQAKVQKKNRVTAAIIFVQTEADVKKMGIAALAQLEEDAVFWMAYPKKTSKKYKAQISRDSGWQSLGELGYEGVSLVAIDEDWSALRFRKAENIKSMTRSFAMSETGKKKAVGQKIKSASKITPQKK